nr:50s ribosomal protein l24 [Quercus suber]
MQAVARRAEYVAKQAAKKALKKRSLQKYDERWSRSREQSQRVQNQNAIIRESRKHRREDWELGSLTPRRDAGENKEMYGSVHVYNYWLPKIPEGKGPETWHISEGDRVVVIRGRGRGKIGAVMRKDEDRASVMVSGVNLVDIQIPGWMNASGKKDAMSIQESEAPISIADVRLVYPLPDPKTGVPRDVIIEKLVKVEDPANDSIPHWQRDPDDDVPEPIRAIPGSNIIIPRPEPVPKDPEEAYEADTKLIQVEEPTFRPYLLHPPMPMTVIDELRNKYSKFRTRHTWEYIEKKEAEEAKQESRAKLMDGMLTPLQQLAGVRKERVVQRELSDDQLKRIGETMARERAALQSAVV